MRLEVDGVGGRRFLLSCSPVRQPDGQVFLLELVADITEQTQLRERLSEAERLAAAGELAAGVAHEIRNPLAAIVNATTLLDGHETLTPEERTSTLDAVRKEARRLNRILSDFLIFARPREPKRLPGDIREVVDHVAALIRDDPARARLVELQTRVDAAVPSFAFDPDQLTQVLLNVALNGVEAMGGRGRLSLEVERRERPRGHRRRGYRARHSSGGAGACLRAVLLEEAGRHRSGADDRPSDRGGPRRPHRHPVGTRAGHAVHDHVAGGVGLTAWRPFSSSTTRPPRAPPWRCSCASAATA